MVNLYATGHGDVTLMIFWQILLNRQVFSLKFKQLICLIEKFSLSLCPYIDNSIRFK